VLQKSAEAWGYFLYQPAGEPHWSGALHLRQRIAIP
jgi:hypothetical protein